MEKVCAFLKEAGAYYLATVDGDQPRVRPFGTIHIYEGKLYIQTGRGKDVAKQLAANPKAEICAFKDGVWLRVAGELVDDNRVEPKKSMLEAYPELRAMYDPEDNNTEVLYFKNAKYDPVTGNLTQRDLVLTSVGEDTYNTYDYVFITADRNSFYYINFYQGLTISKHLDVAVEAPADLETEEYYFNYKTIYETNGTMVEVQAIVDLGVYGDEVYIKGLWEYLPDAWTKGKFVDGKFVLDLPQFVGNYKEEYLGTYPIYVVGFDEHTGLVEPQVTMDYNTTTHVFSNPSKPFGIGINKTGYLNLQDFYEASLVPVYAPGSVTPITADGTGAVEYYDLQGRIITDPATATGIIIVKNADGSVKKVFRK